MFDVFGSLKGLLKVDSVCIDNNIFRLHYKFTVVVLIAFSLVVTSRQYIGDPIDCIVDEIPLSVMDTYCWIQSTFTVSNHANSLIDRDQIHPGVSSYVENEDQVQYHKYYQWVCFVLFFQAICFYIPRYLWKMWEAGRMKMLTLDLACPIMTKRMRSERLTFLLDYFINNFQCQNFYAFRYFFCEVLNLLNVILQIIFVDYFMDGEFSTYGIEVLSFMDLDERFDPMDRVFPKVTKCTFHKYGPSGSVQKFDGLCVLPLNIVNEKIYVFLWFWFIILLILSCLGVIYRSLILFSSSFRIHLLRAKSRLCDRTDIQVLVNKLCIGDWFVLYQLGKNINPLAFKDLIALLANKLLDKNEIV